MRCPGKKCKDCNANKFWNKKSRKKYINLNQVHNLQFANKFVFQKNVINKIIGKEKSNIKIRKSCLLAG